MQGLVTANGLGKLCAAWAERNVFKLACRSAGGSISAEYTHQPIAVGGAAALVNRGCGLTGAAINLMAAQMP